MAFSTAAETAESFQAHLVHLLSKERGIDLPALNHVSDDKIQFVPDILVQTAALLRNSSHPAEAEALEEAADKLTLQPSLGGLGLSNTAIPTQAQYDEALFLSEAWLASVTSNETSPIHLSISRLRAPNAKPMTLAQKIFTQHAMLPNPTSTTTGLLVGDVTRFSIDWVLASELSWADMARTHDKLGSPGIWKNDRLWIAGDHVVHPSITSEPKIKAYVAAAEKAKRQFRLTDYQGMNYTIMHTEFVRERAEPGMLVLGSGSHTCSAGAVGCLAIGLGTADVMMALSLGETWFKIPSSILIEFVGEPGFGISGKDVILYILKVLRRNTVAAERIVEFSGPGARSLSVDARFAICNMCTEFGAITGLFVPDDVTKEYVGGRRRKMHRSNSIYFRPDQEAVYAGRYEIDLTAVEPSVAVYPNPDDVVPVSEKAGMRLDGVFIGACTTTEEELVLAALVLKVGLAKGLPLAKGKRHYVPGSLPIVQKLQKLGLLEIYQEAGFTRGPPGCSMCVGLSAEKASEGETWLSSQNRNFQNRMGKGSFGHLSSAMVCAASSFSMTVTGPAEFLEDIDREFFRLYKGVKDEGTFPPIQYVEPKPKPQPPVAASQASPTSTDPPPAHPIIASKIVTLPDFIDTDALAPGPTLTTCTTDEEFGAHVLEYTHPDFRTKVASGHRVVVAGKAFGVGSSREVAVSALKGAGVQAVIARSFAFIYARNQPSLGLWGIVMEDEGFFEVAKEGEEIRIDVAERKVWVGEKGGEEKEFEFSLSDMEFQLTVNRGVAEAYARYGKAIWSRLMLAGGEREQDVGKDISEGEVTASADSRLEW